MKGRMPSAPMRNNSPLRRARLGRALTQQEVADAIGVAQPVISLWEQGKSEPSRGQREALEQLLGPLTFEDDDGDRGGLSSGPFGAWLKRARETRGLLVPALAAKANVTPATIYNLESGRSGNHRKPRGRHSKLLSVRFRRRSFRRPSVSRKSKASAR